MKDDVNYVCPKCATQPETEVQDSKELLIEDGTRLEIVDKFCYLGDMIGAAGGAEDASRTPVRCGWTSLISLPQYGHYVEPLIS